MPYARSLQQYTPPEFYQEPPAAWEARLREVSPIVPNADHLRLRYFAAPGEPGSPNAGWNYPERGQWALYSCRPAKMVRPELAEVMRLHWSELPVEKQAGRRAIVSEFQHFLWHIQGVYAKPFLILQGEFGGTPAKYTPKEEAFLSASDCIAHPFPIGFFPACAFDERTVQQIGRRDRLLQCANDYHALEQMDSEHAMAAEDEAAELVRRQTYMDTWRVMIQPQVEFMDHFLKRSENRETLPVAPDGLGDRVAQWRDTFMETGAVVGASVAHQRRVNRTIRPSRVLPSPDHSPALVAP